jgi:TPP-dependent indolepyruvate ferredoxin oxidoreductase alpha subunit
MRIIGHLITTGCRTVWRILFMSLFAAALAAGVAILVGYEGTRQWPPTQLMYVAAGAFAVLSAYAVGLTVLLSESVKALVDAAKLAEREAVAPIKAVGRELEGRDS